MPVIVVPQLMEQHCPGHRISPLYAIEDVFVHQDPDGVNIRTVRQAGKIVVETVVCVVVNDKWGVLTEQFA